MAPAAPATAAAAAPLPTQAESEPAASSRSPSPLGGLGISLDDDDELLAQPLVNAAAAAQAEPGPVLPSPSCSESESRASSPFADGHSHDEEMIMDDEGLPSSFSSSSSSSSALASASAAGAASALLEALPLSLQSAPLNDDRFIHDFLRCFLLYGYCLIRADSSRRDLALLLGALRAAIDAAKITKINGNVDMLDVSDPANSARVELLKLWDDAVLALVDQLGQPASARHVSARSLLAAEPGRGRQVLHFDGWEGPDIAPDTLSVLTFCSNPATSTFLPRFSLAHFQPNMSDPASMQDFSYLLEPQWYYSVAVQPGDMLIFSQRIPHWGPENTASVPRLAAFCQVSRPPPPKLKAPAAALKRKARAPRRRLVPRPAAPKEPTADTEEAFQVTIIASLWLRGLPRLLLCSSFSVPSPRVAFVFCQMFVWRWMGIAYGYDSDQTVRALLDGAGDLPFSRYDPNKDDEWTELAVMIKALTARKRWTAFLRLTPPEHHSILNDYVTWARDEQRAANNGVPVIYTIRGSQKTAPA